MAVRVRKKPSFNLDIDMTPMIDVVFNLIIFFMVITDMTQQELEYLILPKAELAIEDKPDKKKERLILNIVDPTTEANKARHDPSGLPIWFKGAQMADWDHLRRELKRFADPRDHPEKEHPETGQKLDPVGVLNGRPIWPSSVALLVRCDQGQMFGWVQAVMQVCTIMPGHSPNRELAESPFIYKIELAVAEKDQDKKR